MDLSEFGRDILNRQPFSRLLGTEILAFTPGRAELRLALREDLQQQHGFAHGGVISYLADNALTFAAGSALGGEGIVTQEMKVNYIRPGIGTALIARAEAISSGKSQAVVRCDVFSVAADGSEKLCAAAQGTIARLPKG